MTFNPLRYSSCLAVPRRLTDSAWQEHIPFAFSLVEMLPPRVFVELGTHNGDSYCAFCQAVEMQGLPTGACFGAHNVLIEFQPARYYCCQELSPHEWLLFLKFSCLTVAFLNIFWARFCYKRCRGRDSWLA